MLSGAGDSSGEDPIPPIRVDHERFVRPSTGEEFRPRGFNYDHDRDSRLIEEYWDSEWATVEEDFAEMKELGANIVRIHLQFAKFMKSATEANEETLDRLGKLVKLAERTGLYLDLTGLGCYRKRDVPKWYDELSEADRWEAQASFWKNVAARCKGSPAVFCYDLMNEPVVPGGGKREDWLGKPFGEFCFVQFISLDVSGRVREDVAVAWTRKLVGAIREVDRDHLVTVGLVDWSLPGKGLYSGFDPKRIAPEVDFLCTHIYPERGKVAASLDRLAGFQVGKPVVIEETFPLKCGIDEFDSFLRGAKGKAAGYVSFYWGKTPTELRASRTIADAMMLGFLEYFRRTAGK